MYYSPRIVTEPEKRALMARLEKTAKKAKKLAERLRNERL